MIFNVGAGGTTDANKIKYGDSNVGATLDNLNESVDELNESLGGIEFSLDADGKGQYRAVGASEWAPFLTGAITEINVGLIDNASSVKIKLDKNINDIQFLLVSWVDMYALSTPDMVRVSIYIKENGWKNFAGRTASATDTTLTLACGSGYKSSSVTVWYN